MPYDDEPAAREKPPRPTQNGSDSRWTGITLPHPGPAYRWNRGGRHADARWTPSANARIVTVAGVPFYLDRRHIVVNFTIDQVAIAVHVLAAVQGRDDLIDEIGLTQREHRASLTSAVSVLNHAVRDQIDSTDATDGR